MASGVAAAHKHFQQYTSLKLMPLNIVFLNRIET